MINLQPTLSGKLLSLRPLLSLDFEPLLLAASDPLIWANHPQPLRYQREVFQKYFLSGMECKGALTVWNQSGSLIGCSRYYDYRPDLKDITIGYTFLTRDYWGGLFNREMKHLMMTHIYQYVDNILFSVGENNVVSRKAVAKIGGILLNEAQIKWYKLTDKIAGNVYYLVEKKNYKD